MVKLHSSIFTSQVTSYCAFRVLLTSELALEQPLLTHQLVQFNDNEEISPRYYYANLAYLIYNNKFE